jgi:hypothetical protein
LIELRLGCNRRARSTLTLGGNFYRKDMSINLNNYSFDEWVKFVFDHPVFEPAWYWDDAWNWEGDPNVVLKNASQLFSSPEFLLQEFSPESSPVRSAMLESLSRILKIESLDCQISALHGLGHITHGDKKKVIEDFLNVHSTLDEKTRKYAREAMEGRVQ